MGKFSKIIAFVLAFLLVFQAGLSGNFSKIYADELEESFEAAEEIEPKTVIDSNVTLHKDTVYKDLYIQSGSLNLNGYKLEVSGNIIHSGGVLNINGGKLFVKGDYRIQRERETNDGVVYERGSGYLNMTNDEDYVLMEVL